jgi:hypothetical protein
MRKPLYSREYHYLNKFAYKDLDPETIQAIKDKRVILEDEPLFVRRKIAGGGEIDLLTSDLDESIGITNIDKQTLPKFINFIVSGILFAYGKAATLDNKKSEEVVYSSLRDAVPVQLQHSNFIIRQNDTPLLTLPMKMLLTDEKLREFLGDAGYELKYPRTIKQNVKFQLSIKFPNGQSLPGTEDHFVEVFLNGSRTRLRGAK